MARIDRLTPEQEAQLAEVRDEWQAAPLATGPAERLRAEQGIRSAYMAAGLPAPSLCIWARSPLEAALGAGHLAAEGGSRIAVALEESYLELAGRPQSGLWGRVWAPFVAPADDPLRGFLAKGFGFDPRAIAARVDSVWDLARRQLRPLITAGLAAQIRIDVGAPVRRRVVDRVLTPIGAQLQTEIWPRLKAHLGAQQTHSSAWLRRWAVVMDLYRLLRVQDAVLAPTHRRTTPDRLAMADAFDRVCGLDGADCLHGLMEVARACGGWWPNRSGVLLCERPVRLALDDQGRLHSGSGAAVEYPDGWSIWAWHGVRVPPRVIEDPESLRAQEILAERDVEVRRAMIERVGNDRFIRDAGGQRVAEDDTGVLWRLDLPNDEPLVCVEVTDASPARDATFRRYVLRVPPRVYSPREAVAWTFGIGAEEYRPAAES